MSASGLRERFDVSSGIDHEGSLREVGPGGEKSRQCKATLLVLTLPKRAFVERVVGQNYLRQHVDPARGLLRPSSINFREFAHLLLSLAYVVKLAAS